MTMRVPSLVAVAVAVAVSALASCGGGGKPPTDEPVDDRPGKKAIIGWGTSPAAAVAGVPQVEVFLSVTEETGKAVSYSVGTYPGECTVIGPVETYKALTAINCMYDKRGIQLHAAHNPGEIVVLRMQIAPGVMPDPFSREPVISVRVPIGATVTPALQ